MSKKIRVADYIANFVYKKNVKDFFLLPGGGAMFLVDALGNHEGLNFVACHHEQSVTIAAEAYSRITQNFGVGLVTTGPGTTNAITGVVGAWIESVPMMMISGQVKRSDLIGNRNIRQGGVQEVDIVSMVSNHTKYAVTVEDPQKIRYYMEKAYFEMMNGRKGPVWIDVPLDVQSSLINIDELLGFEKPDIKEQELNQTDIDCLIKLINEAKRPLILAGHGVRLSSAEKSFKALVNELEIPVVVTWNAMDLIEHDHKLFVGKPGVVAFRAGNFAVQNCDLLIIIGSRVDNIITAYNPKRFAKNAKKVIIDIDLNEIENHQIDFELGIQSNAKLLMDALLSQSSKIDKNSCPSWIEKCNYWKNKYTIDYECDFSKNKEMSHFQFANVLSQELKGGELISTGSSGLGIEAFYVAFNVKIGQRLFLTSGLGAMGYGLPAAIGASIANNKKPIIAIESDGSLQLNIQELAILKGQNLPICLFIMDNSGYASIRNTQKNYFEERYVATGEEGQLHMPKLDSICKAYELDVEVVETEEELRKAIKKFENLTKPLVVVVKTMKNETLMPKSSSMPQKDGTIVSMPLEDMTPLLPIEELEENMYFELDKASYEARAL